MATVPEQPSLLPLAIAPFGRWKYEDAVREAKARLPSDYNIKKSYGFDRDHYRKGEEWVGPGDPKANDKISKQFAPEDAVGEALFNVSNAFSEPQVGSAPLVRIPEGQAIPPELQAQMQEAVSLLTEWWDKRRLQELIQDRQRTTAWSGFSGLRLWVPWRFLRATPDGSIIFRETDDIAEALSYIHIMAPLPDVGCIVTDPGTQDQCAIFFDEEVEYDSQGTKTTYKRAEMVFLDPNRETDEDAATIVRIVYADETRRPTLEARLDLGGRLMFTEMVARSLLTDPVIRTQRQLNLLTTIITRLAETAAFRERYTKNARPQGLRVLYEEGDSLPNGAFLERDDEGRQWMVVPQERTLGANTTTELVGLPQYDPTTGDQRGNQMPDVVIVDPVDPKPYLEAADATRRRILRMCSQGHLGGISNAEASGIAYEQARSVFEKDLNSRRVAEEGMLRELLTAVLALAEVIAGQPGFYTNKIRITVDQHVNAGPRSPDLVRLDLEAYEAGVLSHETTMSRMGGVEDLDAETLRVRRSTAHIMEVIEKAVATTTAFTPESVIEVLKKLGLPEDIVNLLEAKEAPEPEPTPPSTDE